jgi:hypothetical protein
MDTDMDIVTDMDMDQAMDTKVDTDMDTDVDRDIGHRYGHSHAHGHGYGNTVDEIFTLANKKLRSDSNSSNWRFKNIAMTDKLLWNERFLKFHVNLVH